MKYCLQYTLYIHPTKQINLLILYQSKLSEGDYVIPSSPYTVLPRTSAIV